MYDRKPFARRWVGRQTLKLFLSVGTVASCLLLGPPGFNWHSIAFDFNDKRSNTNKVLLHQEIHVHDQILLSYVQ